MREIAPLLAVLVVLLLAESLVWVPRGRQLLLAWRRDRHRLLDGEALLGTQRGGFALLAPWLWGGEAFACGGNETPAIADIARGPQSLRGRLQRARLVLKPLRVAAQAEWLASFVAFPGLVAWRGLASTWPVLLAMLLLSHAVTLTLMWRAHRALYSSARAARWGLTLRLAASPPAAVRAADALLLPLFQSEHPIAVALAVGAHTDAAHAARRALVDARQNETESSLRRIFEAWTLDVTALLQPPPKEHAGCLAYCPRCLTQYTERVPACATCVAVTLLPLD